MTVADHQTLISHVVNDPNLRPYGHVSATGAIILSWTGILTPVLTAIATIMAILWYGVTLYESKTVQEWLARRKSRKLIGDKATAQNTASDNLAVAKDAVRSADALPKDKA